MRHFPLPPRLGFRWFASDEGVLGRTLNIGFGRDARRRSLERRSPVRAAARETRGSRNRPASFAIITFPTWSGFVYSRMDAASAAEDLYRRIRTSRRARANARPADFAAHSRRRKCLGVLPRQRPRISCAISTAEFPRDPEMRALTVSEALRDATEVATVEGIVPGSWINANFDVWIGDKEDVTAWELLGAARDFYAEQLARRKRGDPGAPTEAQLAAAFEALLMAEGSDWCWWFGPEHSSANDDEFDAFFRQLLSEVLSEPGPRSPRRIGRAHQAKVRAGARRPALGVSRCARGRARIELLRMAGRGALLRPSAGTVPCTAGFTWLNQFRYGFSRERFYIRVDAVEGALAAFAGRGISHHLARR